MGRSKTDVKQNRLDCSNAWDNHAVIFRDDFASL